MMKILGERDRARRLENLLCAMALRGVLRVLVLRILVWCASVCVQMHAQQRYWIYMCVTVC